MIPVTLLWFWLGFFLVCGWFVCLVFLGLGEKRARRKQMCDWFAQSLFQSQCGCLSS